MLVPDEIRLPRAAGCAGADALPKSHRASPKQETGGGV